jgi:hypothetical protein
VATRFPFDFMARLGATAIAKRLGIGERLPDVRSHALIDGSERVHGFVGLPGIEAPPCGIELVIGGPE